MLKKKAGRRSYLTWRWCITAAPQSRNKESPHYVMVGRQLKFPVDLGFSRATVPAATETVSEMQAVWEQVRQQFKKTQAKYKATADQHKRTVETKAGDRVLRSTRNLKLKGKTCTFKPKYVGPFPILRMVGHNACELELPEAMKTHPVVNVIQVKKYHGLLQRPSPIEIDGE